MGHLEIAPADPDDQPPLHLVTHYVTNIFDFTEPTLCQRARQVTDRLEDPLPWGHWLTTGGRVTCTDCLGWLHA